MTTQNTGAILSYSKSILRDEYWAQRISMSLRDNHTIHLGHRTYDRLNSSRVCHPQLNEPRKLLKQRLREIGKTLSKFKNMDDSVGAIEYINSQQWGWREHFDSADIFNTIFDEYFFICHDCGVLEYDDNQYSCYDGDYSVCESCCDDNYRWSDNRDTYITCDDYYDEEQECEDDEPSHIGCYHSSKRMLGHIPSAFDKHKKPIYLGLELEMEIKDDYSRNDKAEQLLSAIGTAQVDGKNYTYALCESDGSLNHGFEMVTGYTGLDTHAKQLEFFRTPFRGAKSHDTRTCGLHVHICKSDMTLLHCAKMVLFINESSNQRLVRAIARRDSQHYSKITNKKASYEWLKNAKDGSKAHRIQRLNTDRYEALNFQNEKTIEFRLFKGTLKYESIMASLEFTYATWHFCKDTSTNDLITDKFLEFICLPENLKHTRYLRAYLKDKGFNVILNKVNPRAEKTVQSISESDSVEA